MFRRAFLTAVLAGVGAMGVGGVARADHDSFEWRGPTYGFHGEEHIIRALAKLERAYDCRGRDAEYIEDAILHTRRAVRLVCHSRARYYLGGAYEHMAAFVRFGDVVDLDDANRLLRKALAIETGIHRHHHDDVVPLPAPPRHYDRSGRGGPYFGSNRGGMYFGSSRGGLFIRF